MMVATGSYVNTQCLNYPCHVNQACVQNIPSNRDKIWGTTIHKYSSGKTSNCQICNERSVKRNMEDQNTCKLA